MARRGDPTLILEAQREGTRQRLISSPMPAERVDELLGAFDALPDRQGRPWDAEEAYRWVLAQPRRSEGLGDVLGTSPTIRRDLRFLG
jgi:hypothetical protein